MTRAEALDRWIRTTFVELNTALEGLYFAQDDRSRVVGTGDAIKAQLRDEGHALIVPLLVEGNTGGGFGSAFDLLGNVGLYMGALRRHELTNPDLEERSPFADASALALHVGASAGMAPRFATAHLATHNLAVNGVRKSFTSLADEFLFIDENARGILSLQRAADALSRIVPLGVSSPVADILFEEAARALGDVVRFNERLFTQLDVERFFFCVRPYYKPYRVGRNVYRGANAGDFSGINEIDLLLGLLSASDPYYSQLLLEKMPFMLPGDQARLRDCMSRRSLLDEFLLALDAHGEKYWFQTNAAAYLKVCEMFAAAWQKHHNQLVSRFIEGPAATLEAPRMQGLTASGPPLPVLLRSLEMLRDYRCAAPRSDIPTRYADLERLRHALAATQQPEVA